MIVILHNFVLPLPHLQQESPQYREGRKQNLMLVINQAETWLKS